MMTATQGGPYHRVKSPNGYSWSSGYVHLGTKKSDLKVDNATETLKTILIRK